MNRFKIAQYIALGATALSLVGLILNIKEVEVGSSLLVLGLLAGIVSYFFGGFLTAIKMAWRLAKVGWFIVPAPYCFATFIFTFVFAIYVFMFLPIIPVRKAYKESL